MGFFMPAKRKLPAKKHASDNDSDAHSVSEHVHASSDSEIDESPQEKRIRLAKEYINAIAKHDNIEDGNEYGFDAKDVDDELVAGRLRDDALAAAGKLITPVASSIQPRVDLIKKVNGIGSITCLTVSPDDRYIFVAGKSSKILKYSLTGDLLHTFEGQLKSKTAPVDFNGHSDHVLCLATTKQYMISGSLDKTVCIWNIETNEFIRKFTNHRDSVLSLTVQHPQPNSPNSLTMLYTASADRTVKVYNLTDLAYVETLFGHQDHVSCISAIGTQKQRCVTVGSRDRTLRLWKIPEESQLVYRASSSGSRLKSLTSELREIVECESNTVVEKLALDQTGTVDCVSFVDDETWVSGSDGGTLALWSSHKKKPLYVLPCAHGRTMTLSSGGDDPYIDRENAVTVYRDLVEKKESVSNSLPCWISAVSAVPYTDLVISGSCDSWLRFWAINRETNSLNMVARVGVSGWINSIAVTNDGKKVIVGTGREPKSGRWSTKSGKDSIQIIAVK